MAGLVMIRDGNLNMAKEYETPLWILKKAHSALYERQQKLGRNLKYAEARSVLIRSPGFPLGAGNSAQDLLDDLDRYRLVNLNPQVKEVYVIPREGPESLKQTAQRLKAKVNILRQKLSSSRSSPIEDSISAEDKALDEYCGRGRPIRCG